MKISQKISIASAAMLIVGMTGGGLAFAAPQTESGYKDIPQPSPVASPSTTSKPLLKTPPESRKVTKNPQAHNPNGPSGLTQEGKPGGYADPVYPTQRQPMPDSRAPQHSSEPRVEMQPRIGLINNSTGININTGSFININRTRGGIMPLPAIRLG